MKILNLVVADFTRIILYDSTRFHRAVFVSVLAPVVNTTVGFTASMIVHVSLDSA